MLLLFLFNFISLWKELSKHIYTMGTFCETFVNHYNGCEANFLLLRTSLRTICLCGSFRAFVLKLKTNLQSFNHLFFEISYWENFLFINFCLFCIPEVSFLVNILIVSQLLHIFGLRTKMFDSSLLILNGAIWFISTFSLTFTERFKYISVAVPAILQIHLFDNQDTQSQCPPQHSLKVWA